MPRMIGKYREDFLRKRAAKIAAMKTKNSNILCDKRENLVPRFDPSELFIGKELGEGGFCTVHEITKVHLEDKNNACASTKTIDTESETDDENDHFQDSFTFQNRQFIAKNYLRSGKDARYVVKKMISGICDPSRFLGGVVDLAIETRFLSVINHPNIIKMRAMSCLDPYEDCYFIVLDRLYDTLADRLDSWKALKKKMVGINWVRDLGGSKKKQLWVDRFMIAYDLCSALQYLHRNRILYRDLKPDNIGFDVRGDVKIFDFGLAKELIHEDQMDNEVYKLSGKTGSLRYMAPEVAKMEPYNTSADVYSFAVLLWQMCSLSIPFKGCTVESHFELVVMGGCRPEIDPSWSAELSTLLTRGWSEDLYERPAFGEIMVILRSLMSPIMGNSEPSELDISNRTAKSVEARCG